MKNLKHFTTTRGTYSNGNYSSFWLDDEFDRQTSIFDDEEDVKPKTDLIALSSYRRAIGNFVRIVTQQDIPVTFKSSGDSYTDGKKVVISAKMDDKSFDPSVGLALHEGSHIKLSDFDFLKDLAVQTRRLQPLSSNYFIEETGEMKIVAGVRKFRGPETLDVEGLHLRIDSAAFSLSAWIQLRPKASANVLRKPLGVVVGSPY